ncbi:MAG: aminoacyltransferase [Actinobacteria bacterium]|nr:aminoacyltransferase [Actinomycetota bacterium]
MQIKIVDDQFDHLKWNNYATHPLQAWEWGEARKEMGIKVVRIMETDQVNLNNVYQLTIHQIPKTSFYIGYVPRSVIPSLKAMDFFRSYAKKNRIIFIKFEPNIENIGNNKKMLVKSPHPLFPTWTQVIDLQKNENILLMQMKPKTRYNIKLAQKKGVIVREISDDKGFSIFIKLYFETCKRQKYFGHDYNYHKIVWKNLKNGIAHILIAPL